MAHVRHCIRFHHGVSPPFCRLHSRMRHMMVPYRREMSMCPGYDHKNCIQLWLSLREWGNVRLPSLHSCLPAVMAKWLRLLLISGLCRKPGMQEIKSLSRQLNSAYSKLEHGTCLIVRLMSRVTRARSSTIAYLLHEMDGSSDLFKYRCRFTILVLPDVNRVCGNLMDQ